MVKEDLLVPKDGIIKVNFKTSKRKEKEFSSIKKTDINIKDLGQVICLMVKENKHGKIKMGFQSMKENF
jgi:hypothetical protein